MDIIKDNYRLSPLYLSFFGLTLASDMALIMHMLAFLGTSQ